MADNFFPVRPKYSPTIYAYTDSNPQYKGLMKIGFTTKSALERVSQQYPIKRPGPPPFAILLEEVAMKNDGSIFTDHDVHRLLRKKGIANPIGEWFRCSVADVKSAINSIKNGVSYSANRQYSFSLRPEQTEAIEKTIKYYREVNRSEPNKIPRFLWNAKMRFGKTFTAYKLAQKMKWEKVLILTFKPAVQNAWEEDLLNHVDFEGWQFISRDGLTYENANKTKPIICFGSFQDYLGKNNVGGIKLKNEWVHSINWDCVIFDEYHYGAWRDSAKDLFEAEDRKEMKLSEGEGLDYFDEDLIPITTFHYLYLSGTPFRAIASGEFIEEQIFNWTYSDEQRAKENWKKPNNPYKSLPRMVLMTYQMPESIRNIALNTEYNEFDLNVFFSASGDIENAKFRYENEVQKWIDLIRGSLSEAYVDDLRQGTKKPPLPFSDVRLLDLLSHTFWFLPSVSSCYAMANLLKRRQNKFFKDYNVIVAAGNSAGMGVEALKPVLNAMTNPLESKTITLSCGKLTTGVTVKPWSGIFILRNSSSPETYFQAAFRVQSPWTIRNIDGLTPNDEVNLKNECYVFDFSPNRALRQIAEYSCRLNVEDSDAESKVSEFIRFLPILAYDGSSMKQIDAAGILDIAMSGTTATLLARRWESALLVNVDNETLKRLLNNESALQAIMNIEGFRNLNQEIQTIISKSDSVKKLKKEASERELSTEEKKTVTEEEKKYKDLRKKIQDKLIKFATRIPVFMYLTDYRERSLKDIITQLEPGLFQKVTGLKIVDFEQLVSIGVFNSAIMNDAVYKFKRYEDASLTYSGVIRHQGLYVGLFDTVISKSDYDELSSID